MDFKELAPGQKIPVLGIGTWEMGGRMTPEYSNDEKHINAIRLAIDLGMTHIDTAEMYGGGHTEELVAEAIKGMNRENLFITTKVSPENLRYDDVLKAADRSLKRMRLDYIDLYLVHIPNPGIPIKHTMKAMDRLVEDNIIRFMGVSNFNVAQLKEAQRFCSNRIVTNQIEYNLFSRNIGMYNQNMESEIVPYCLEHEITITAWRPLDKGMIGRKKIPILDEMVSKYKKTRAQIAIHWLISQDNIITIPKASNPVHIRENMGALEWKMDQEDKKKLSLCI